MKNIIKKKLPDRIAKQLARPANEEEFSTYYVIDDEVYVHTKFYVEEENPPLTLIHDMAHIESEMIKAMKAKNKVYLDEDKVPFFCLFDLSLWFYERIPSKDWYELLGFLRIIKEHDQTTNYIVLSNDEEPPTH